MLAEAEAPRVVEALPRRRAWQASLALVLLSFAFRLPALASAKALLNSDSAVVGLQAMHLLRGEWSPFLWGSGYQTSTDSMVVAALFSVLGPTPFAVMLAPLLLHVVLTWLVFDTLSRALPRRPAFVASLPLVFCSSPSHTYILYPPRQAALTLAMAAVWFISRAPEGPPRPRRRLWWLGLGGALATLAVHADPYALVMFPAVATFAALSLSTRGEVAVTTAGALVGIAPYVWLRALPGASHVPFRLSCEVVSTNARLLVDTCLPWALGARAFVPAPALAYVPFRPGVLLGSLEGCAGGSLFLLILAGPVLAVLPSAVRPAWITWPLRRLAIVGGVAASSALAGFLTSRMVLDLFSARYLASLVLFAPFALAPLAARFGSRFAPLLAPALVASAWAAWVGFAPARASGPAPDEAALAEALRARGVEVAAADYWASYRLTFMTREALRVVPLKATDDRYAPYRDELRAAPRFAYVFDPVHSVESLAAVEVELAAADGPLGPSGPIERLAVGGYQALVLERRSALRAR